MFDPKRSTCLQGSYYKQPLKGTSKRRRGWVGGWDELEGSPEKKKVNGRKEEERKEEVEKNKTRNSSEATSGEISSSVKNMQRSCCVHLKGLKTGVILFYAIDLFV